jgi:hypothetical protein
MEKKNFIAHYFFPEVSIEDILIILEPLADAIL